MSQHNEVEQLRARLERNEREKLELIQQLSRAQSYATPTAPGYEVSHGNYQTSTSCLPPSNNGRSRINTLPLNTASDSRPQPKQVPQVRPCAQRRLSRNGPLHAHSSAGPEPPHEALQDHTHCGILSNCAHDAVKIEYLAPRAEPELVCYQRPQSYRSSRRTKQPSGRPQSE